MMCTQKSTCASVLNECRKLRAETRSWVQGARAAHNLARSLIPFEWDFIGKIDNAVASLRKLRSGYMQIARNYKRMRCEILIQARKRS